AAISSEWGSVSHNIVFGIKRHFDHSERLQRNSTYTQLGGALILDDLGLLGNAGNQEQDARVWAAWVRDEIEIGRLTLAPGLRFERIDQDRIRFETRLGETADPSVRTEANVRDRRSNSTDVFIPGIGFVYDFSGGLSLYGGAHKGFSAPTNAPGVREEESINYEFGARFSTELFVLDAAYFLTDYDNLLGTCTVSSGIDCEVGDAFNGDAATVQGLELQVGYVMGKDETLQFPVQLTFTHIDGEFDSDIASTDFFGAVMAGDPLPYIPENQGLLSFGVEAERWDTYVSYNFVDETCIRGSCGAFEQTESLSVVDVSSRWRQNDKLVWNLTLENVFDNVSISARTPYGARPNKDRTLTLGLRLSL
ncbi:MAG: TonB-dependent receptor, partial [Pseudomonadota bacterium]